jgi:putative transposase
MSWANAIEVSDRQREILERWIRNQARTAYRLVERARIIVMSADGTSNAEQGRRLGIDRQRIRRWRTRWGNAQEALEAAESKGAGDRDLTALVEAVLSDEPRRGGPCTFSAEQLTRIIAVACEPPEDCDRPVTHWTPRELVQEVTKRGIVETISPRHIARFLKKTRSDRTRASTG